MSPMEEIIAKAIGQRADRIVETLCDIVPLSFDREIRSARGGSGERDCQALS